MRAYRAVFHRRALPARRLRRRAGGKSSRRGKLFYSCSAYPKCDYALWDKPVQESCPACGSPLLVEKTSKARGRVLACPEKSCRYVRSLEEGEAAPEDDASLLSLAEPKGDC